MHVLALDTTTRDGSVAIVDEQGIIDERRGDAARSQAGRLPGELIALVDARGMLLSGIDVFAVAAGPGSFTGLRIGIATIQGLALTTGKRIVGVSALEALAHIAGGAPGTFVAAWMDARRHDVFAALYRVADAPRFSPERLVEVEGATVGDPLVTLARWGSHLRDANVIFAGDGAALYAEEISGQRSTGWAVLAEPLLLAGAIGRIALARAQRGDTIDPAAVHPLYVRRPDAEVEREKRLG
jgi:tRNA threonylcarbamoyladenosine biosynthesis protein TsaB